jgi:hypothetical protein
MATMRQPKYELENIATTPIPAELIASTFKSQCLGTN